MTEPRTEAGRALVRDVFWERSPNRIRETLDDAIPAIEAEAVAAERSRIVGIVEGIRLRLAPSEAMYYGIDEALAAIREETT